MYLLPAGSKNPGDKKRMGRLLPVLGIAGVGLVAGLGVIISFPVILALSIQHEQDALSSAANTQFPVTVDPINKVIVEKPEVNEFLESSTSPLQATVWNTENIFGRVFTWVATSIAGSSWYQNIAAVSVGGRFVTITPGMRKEQVANAFGKPLAWNTTQKQKFVTPVGSSALPLPEGSFSPGMYFVSVDTTPAEAQALINAHFSSDILSHYGTSTAEVVPLNQALTVASLIEREAGGPDDMRIISGIIWNRLFLNMKLQIDATLQYVKASTPATAAWWPGVVPDDRFRKSVYNTYLHVGLPPNPIANPSVASVLAALNPKSTSCLFYFHDDNGHFHCTNTYAEHVTMLKKYFGRGK